MFRQNSVSHITSFLLCYLSYIFITENKQFFMFARVGNIEYFYRNKQLNTNKIKLGNTSYKMTKTQTIFSDIRCKIGRQTAYADTKIRFLFKICWQEFLWERSIGDSAIFICGFDLFSPLFLRFTFIMNKTHSFHCFHSTQL